MYKLAQSAQSVAISGGAPVDQMRSPRFRPSVRSVPLALDPSNGTASQSGAGPSGASPRPLILAAIGIAVVAVIVFLLVLVLGGGGGPIVPDSSPSPSPPMTPALPTAALDTPAPTAAVTADPLASPSGSPAPISDLRLAMYEVQEGEALLAIAETFGVTRRQIILANEGMAEARPYTEPGQTIYVPLGAELTAEQVAAIEALPGFRGYLE
jgi:hypothetical protein